MIFPAVGFASEPAVSSTYQSLIVDTVRTDMHTCSNKRASIIAAIMQTR